MEAFGWRIVDGQASQGNHVVPARGWGIISQGFAVSEAQRQPEWRVMQPRVPLPSPLLSPSSFIPAQRKRKRRPSRKELDRHAEKEQEDSRMYNLTLDTNELKQQIATLLAQKELIQARVMAKCLIQSDTGSVAQLARHYFGVFQRAFQPRDARKQWDFVLAVMDEGCTIGNTGFGRDMIVKPWQLYGQSVHQFQYSLHHLDVIDCGDGHNIAVAHGGYGGHLRRELLQMVFPHVLGNEMLISKLLGRYIFVPGIIRLYTNENNRIVRCDLDADLFSAFQQLAEGDVDLLAALFDGAIINEESMLDDGQ